MMIHMGCMMRFQNLDVMIARDFHDFDNGGPVEITKSHFFIHVIAHNMRGYDSHIILKYLTKQFPEEQITSNCKQSGKVHCFRYRFIPIY